MLLFTQGIAGVAGALVVSRFLDRFGWRSLVVGVGLTGAGLVALWAFGASPAGAVAALALFGGAWGAVPPTMTHRIMQSAPSTTEMGVAIHSSIFNVGIASGSALGSLLAATLGIRAVPAFGAVLVAAGVAVAIWERRSFGPEPRLFIDVEAALAD
jgi:predicted MFS family arabinose efflux permease